MISHTYLNTRTQYSSWTQLACPEGMLEGKFLLVSLDGKDPDSQIIEAEVGPVHLDASQK